MESRTEIITRLFKDPDIAEAIGKMKPVDLQDELRSEMFLVLCEMQEEKLLAMNQNKYIKFYLVRTMLTMIKSDRSTFYTKFRRAMDELPAGYEAKDTDYQPGFEVDAVSDAIKDLHWYEAEVVKQYAEIRNISELSRRTKIPYRSLSQTLSDAKKKIKEAVKIKKRKGDI